MLIPLKYNFRSLRVRRLTTLMTALGIGLTVSVFIAVMALVEGMRETFVSTGEALNLLVIRQGSLTETMSVLDREAVEVIKFLDGVALDTQGEPLVTADRIVFINQPRKSGEPSNLLLRGVGPQVLKLRPGLRLVAGRWFRPGFRELTLSRSIAERFQDCGLGDRLQTGRAEWTVVGIFDAGRTAYGSELWTDVNDLGNAFERQLYSSVLLQARDAAALAGLAETISTDRRLKFKAQREQDYFAEQTKAATPIQAVGWVIAVIMAVGSCFAAMNTMYAAVAHRTREVGMLRVLGFRRWAVLVSFEVEAVLLALLGGVLGGLLSLPLNGVATGTTNWVTFSELTFAFRITPALLLKGMVFAAVMGALGGFLPAFRAAQQGVVTALRAV